MILIYTQDETIIKDNADVAKNDLIRIYGEKLGTEAYAAVKNNRPGACYRKYGGPLVKVVDENMAECIRKKETAVGMM